MDIGTKIKTARLAKGLTQSELGDLIGVQKSAIAKYESGRVVNIKRTTLKKISDILDIPPYELIFNEKSAETDGLSENTQKLMDFVKSVPEDKAELVLRVLRSIVESD